MPDADTAADTLSGSVASDDVDAILAEMAALAEQAESTAAEDQEWSAQQVDAALDVVQEQIADLEHLVEGGGAEPAPVADLEVDESSAMPALDAAEDDEAGPRIVEDDGAEEGPEQENPARARHRLADRLRRVAGRLAAIGVEMILLLDLPFSFLSPMIKSLCGYIALVTLAVAVAAWLLGPGLVQR